MPSIEEVRQFVYDLFKVNIELFIAALRLSPNAQGYVAGSISELLLKEKLEAENDLEMLRIREKWEGEKHSMHRGDFYFRQKGASGWYVLESKGVKSNSEKWHRLYNHDALERFLIKHSDKIEWLDHARDPDHQVQDWIKRNLPRFLTEFSSTLYDYEEIAKYVVPKVNTTKKQAMLALKGKSREEVAELIDERLRYLFTRLRVLETHFVAGTSGSGKRTQATPRKDEFAVVAINIVLKYDQHKFVFALPTELPPSTSDKNHLQQNYVMGFVFVDEHGTPRASLTDLWYENFDDALENIDSAYRIDPKDMQVDERFGG